MSKDEAIKTVQQYMNELSALSMMMALAGMEFSRHGAAVEKALGVPEQALAKALNDAIWTTAFSNYLAVLQNAIDGKLVVATAEDWAEVIDAE